MHSYSQEDIAIANHQRKSHEKKQHKPETVLIKGCRQSAETREVQPTNMSVPMMHTAESGSSTSVSELQP